MITKFKLEDKKGLSDKIKDAGIVAVVRVINEGRGGIEVETPGVLGSNEKEKLKQIFKKQYGKDFVVV